GPAAPVRLRREHALWPGDAAAAHHHLAVREAWVRLQGGLRAGLDPAVHRGGLRRPRALHHRSGRAGRTGERPHERLRFQPGAAPAAHPPDADLPVDGLYKGPFPRHTPPVKTIEHFVPNGDGWHLSLCQTWDEARLDRGRRPVLIVPGYGMNSF